MKLLIPIFLIAAFSALAADAPKKPEADVKAPVLSADLQIEILATAYEASQSEIAARPVIEAAQKAAAAAQAAQKKAVDGCTAAFDVALRDHKVLCVAKPAPSKSALPPGGSVSSK